jgi:hypothetical protein
LAGMLWMNRLVMLEVAVPLEPWPKLGLKSKEEVESVPNIMFSHLGVQLGWICRGKFGEGARAPPAHLGV